jgi:dTDP-glucose 4,6-dehydratase
MRQAPEKLVSLVITKLILNQIIPVYGDGSQIRDWLFVDDHCDAIIRILEERPIGEIFNVSGKNQMTNLFTVKLICSAFDSEVGNFSNSFSKLMRFVKDRPGHDFRYDMNVEKIEARLKFKPKKIFEAGVFETVRWYLNNTKWVKNSLKRLNFRKIS